MESAISTEKELGQALREGKDCIEIEIDLKKKVLRIKAIGKIAWAICIAGIAGAVAIFIATGGTGTPASKVLMVAPIAILGSPAVYAAIAIAVAGGGVGVLNKLRKYKVTTLPNGNILLTKK